jgi:hypothetical protein
MKVLEGSERFVDVVGLAGHTVSQLRIVTAQVLVTTYKGDVIATFHQMALLGKGKSIVSCLQMEAHGADINDLSCLLPGGKQRILMDGYQLPLLTSRMACYTFDVEHQLKKSLFLCRIL